MKITYCDCCKRKINNLEPIYSIEIKRGNDAEHILEDVCRDCYELFASTIKNAETWRISHGG